MKPFRKPIALYCFVVFALLVSACEGSDLNSQADEGLKASGVVEVIDYSIAPELSGRVVEVYVNQGDTVEKGDPLFELDGEMIEAQYRQAESALELAKSGKMSAQANLELAQSGLALAETQYQQVLAAAQFSALPDRLQNWSASQPSEFELPVWYFSQDERIGAARAEVGTAKEEFESAQENYQKVINDIGSKEFVEIETRLLKAQTTYAVIDDLLDRRVSDGEEITDYLRDLSNSAKAELDSAQLEYDRYLSNQDSDAIREARARLTIAEEWYHAAQDNLYLLFTGSNSLDVTAAQAAMDQAEAALSVARLGLEQADQTIEQAQSSLDLLALQKDRLTVYAPSSGKILTRAVETGEIVVAGQTVMSLGDLDSLTVTVYVPEDEYGSISLGDEASVTTDSFSGEKFNATVVRIADEAEYTPRNVQTEEERRNTVFAIELSVEDLDDQLRPGMPVDVFFKNEK